MSDKRIEDGWIERRNALRAKACCNDPGAMLFLSMIMDAVEVWDDLVDKDKVISTEDINRVFMNLVFWLPQNKFFESGKSYLLPIMMTCVNAWMDSDALAKTGDKRKLQAAWWLKQMGVEMYGAVAFLTGGFDHMRAISLEARELLAHEDFTDYLQEQDHA